jgi:hypothetical protein
MKPAHEYTRHATFDLTEGKIHLRPDGQVSILFPKRWETQEKREMHTVKGEVVNWRQYLILEWDEYIIPAKKV